jgi:hypothetical protein
MKKAIILSLLIALIPTTAHAEEKGAWVKVDANGVAIGQAIVCTASVCGDPGSLYNKMTLGTNERYVLQAPASSDGNVAGIGAVKGPGPTLVKVDLETKVWTVVNESKIYEPVITILPDGKEQKTPKIIGTQITTQRFTADQAPWVIPDAVVEVTTVVIPSVTSNFIAQQELEIAALKDKTTKLKNRIKKKAKK